MNRDLLRHYVSFNEGRKRHVYLDTEGIPTIGVGFNLRRSGAKTHIESLGLDYDDVVEGRVDLTEEQIDALLDPDLDSAIKDAQSIFSRFDSLNDTRQVILADMVFNLGRAGLAGFRNMVAAVERGAFDTAADEMMDSRWYRQVAKRGQRNVEAMRTGEMPNFPGT